MEPWQDPRFWTIVVFVACWVMMKMWARDKLKEIITRHDALERRLQLIESDLARTSLMVSRLYSKYVKKDNKE